MKVVETPITKTASTFVPAVDKLFSETIMASFFAGGIVIGLWSMAAIIGSLAAGAGPLGTVSGYFKSVSEL